MADINLDTEVMKEAAKKLNNKAKEMESAVKAANSSFEPCTTMKSKRVKKRVQEWVDIRKKFEKTLEEMLSSSDKLLRAAEGFAGEDEKD